MEAIYCEIPKYLVFPTLNIPPSVSVVVNTRCALALTGEFFLSLCLALRSWFNWSGVGIGIFKKLPTLFYQYVQPGLGSTDLYPFFSHFPRSLKHMPYQVKAKSLNSVSIQSIWIYYFSFFGGQGIPVRIARLMGLHLSLVLGAVHMTCSSQVTRRKHTLSDKYRLCLWRAVGYMRSGLETLDLSYQSPSKQFSSCSVTHQLCDLGRFLNL